MLKRIYYGTNTKMFQTAAETKAFVSRLSALTADLPQEVTLFVIPSYTSIAEGVKGASGGRILIGAQNMGWEERGQFTGEISPLMLLEAGAELVMIGHSERRHVLHETDFEEGKKVRCALEHGFTTLLCIGETAQQKEYGLSMETLRTQLKIALHGLKSSDMARKLWIAYEPVWAIGVNGTPAGETYANEMHGCIKRTLRELFGSAGDGIPVLYGGSVNPSNAPALIRQPFIDGLFIGRSAWDAVGFNKIIRDTLPLRQAMLSTGV